jgi:hypothetical protein
MSAVISPCGDYRYWLERSIDGPCPFIAWVMVNPSTADATEDDATIRKVRGFSTRLGFDRFVVVNKFAYRATDVRQLKRVRDPVGLDNDFHIEAALAAATKAVVAWGPLAKVPAAHRGRWRRVAAIADRLSRDLMCLGTAQDGHPRHPLMLAYDTPLQLWKRPL